MYKCAFQFILASVLRKGAGNIPQDGLACWFNTAPVAVAAYKVAIGINLVEIRIWKTALLVGILLGVFCVVAALDKGVCQCCVGRWHGYGGADANAHQSKGSFMVTKRGKVL